MRFIKLTLIFLISLPGKAQPTSPTSGVWSEIDRDSRFVYDSILDPQNDALLSLIDKFNGAEAQMDLAGFSRQLADFTPSIDQSVKVIRSFEMRDSYLYRKTNKELRDYKQSLTRFGAICREMVNRYEKGGQQKMDELSNSKFINAYHYLCLSRSLLMAAIDTRFYYEHTADISGNHLSLSRTKFRDTGDSIRLLVETSMRLESTVNSTKAELKEEIKKARFWSTLSVALGVVITALLIAK